MSPKIFEPHGFLRFAMSTRRGGVSAEPYGMNMSYHVGDDPHAVRENRRIFLESIGAGEDSLAQPKQCHCATVLRADRPGPYEASDGLVSNKPGLWLGISVADCLPIFLADPARRAIAAVHAGWRGSERAIAKNAVRLMAKVFGTSASELAVYLGPSARACCYEVGPEVARIFSDEVVVRRDERLYLDIVKDNISQLVEMGVSERNIELNPMCTITEKDLLHSYRRDLDRSGRMLGVIGIVS